MTVALNKKLKYQVELDVPRTFGNKTVHKDVLTTLQDILLRLDDYIQGTNIFIGKKLLKEKELPTEENFKTWIEMGNNYVRSVNTVMENISKSGHLPKVKKKETVKGYLKRLQSTWPRLRYALKSVLFEKLKEKDYDVEKNLSSLVGILDGGWISIALGGGNALTLDRENKEKWRDLTYDTLGGGSENPEEILENLREVFVTLILGEGKEVADFVTNIN